MRYPVLEVRGLVNRFGSQVVHNGLDMEVFQDEVFGIVGGSGSGKSVLLRTILGLQRPQAGTVCIEGHDITHMSEAQLRPIKARYGVAFQEGALYSGLTVLENVQLPMIEYFALEKVVLDALALLIGFAGCRHGLRVRGSARVLGHEVTVAVVQAIFLVILADALFAVFFLKLDI